jgi:GAF domain-containing protein
MKTFATTVTSARKAEIYELLLKQAKALIEGETDLIANLANISALIWQSLPDLNWAGFYLWKPAQDALPHPTARSAGGSPLSRSAGEGYRPAAAGRRIEERGELVLGPFQGKPACVRIAYGKGVCGTAVARRETILVEDVDRFPGHIVCDSASRSEIVVPMIRNGDVLGVLDIDSPELARFDAEDQAGLELLVSAIVISRAD